MNSHDYLCNSWAVMLMCGTTDRSVRIEAQEQENSHYRKEYDKEKEYRVNRLWEQEVRDCIKDRMEEEGKDEVTVEMDEGCSMIANENYEEMVQQVESELNNLPDIEGYRKTYIEYYYINMHGSDSTVRLTLYYHEVDEYGQVDKYEITDFVMDYNKHEDLFWDHFSYDNRYWIHGFQGPTLQVFL
jgi:hypothetical protein